MPRSYKITFLILIFYIGWFCTTSAFSYSIEYFSDAPRKFKNLLADPRESQLRVGYLRAGNKTSFLDVGFGGQLGLVDIGYDEVTFLSFAIKGLITSRFQYGSRSFDLKNSDFQGGLSTSYKKDANSIELFISHQSSHYGDDIIAQGLASFKNFSQETFRLLYSYEVEHGPRLYIGPALILRSDPTYLKGKLRITIGGEYFFPFLADFYNCKPFSFKRRK